MSTKDTRQTPFSLIADYDGDLAEVFKEEFGKSLPVLPLRDMMVFPGAVVPVMLGRPQSVAVVDKAIKTNDFIAVMTQRDAAVDEPDVDDLFPIGVACRVMRSLELPDGNRTIILQCYSRFKVVRKLRTKPYLRVSVERLEEIMPRPNDKEFGALVEACRDETEKYLRLAEPHRGDAPFAVRNIKNGSFFINFVCTNVPFSIDDKAMLLREDELKKRAFKLLGVLNKECQFAQLKENIQNRTREDLDQQQREYFLQQQIKNIQQELGDKQNQDAQELLEKAGQLTMPEAIRKTFTEEVEKLERINTQSPDYNVQLNYLQTLVSLPWGKQTKDNLNLNNAKRTLNADHFGMERVKERILEHLAALSYSRDPHAPIICLYGPPGVGKTSLGRSIAKALERKYVRVSLGGVHDEAEIRGHRRTYVGAMPGRILKSLIKAESNNPVFVLDEIDKLAPNNWGGDPQSALLEVLDPEQNNAFHDNFVDIDYDLSEVLFIATANNVAAIPVALRDRMELIEVEGYLTEEKLEIAKRHLVPRHAGKFVDKIADGVRFPAKTLEFIVEKYTRESGVRGLEKHIETLLRKLALKMALDGELPNGGELTPGMIEELLGKPPYNRDRYQGNAYAGVVTGLAWTSVGGEILFIETGVNRSKQPRLTLTGNLGDVMKESAMIALEYIKVHAEHLSINAEVFEQWSVHVHVPEGATPKDGPSAGITIATSIASALTQRKVRPYIAMTGEITLRGKVLPVGGIKEKILAAKRAGIKEIILSAENRKDIEEINKRYVKGLKFHYVDDAIEVLDYALLKERVAHPLDMSVITPSQEEKN